MKDIETKDANWIRGSEPMTKSAEDYCQKHKIWYNRAVGCRMCG